MDRERLLQLTSSASADDAYIRPPVLPKTNLLPDLKVVISTEASTEFCG